jgi:hypothetical protein
VLVTLWLLNDDEARDDRVLQNLANPDAQRPRQGATQDHKLHDPRIWVPYILIE